MDEQVPAAHTAATKPEWVWRDGKKILIHRKIEAGDQSGEFSTPGWSGLKGEAIALLRGLFARAHIKDHPDGDYLTARDNYLSRIGVKAGQAIRVHYVNDRYGGVDVRMSDGSIKRQSVSWERFADELPGETVQRVETPQVSPNRTRTTEGAGRVTADRIRSEGGSGQAIISDKYLNRFGLAPGTVVPVRWLSNDRAEITHPDGRTRSVSWARFDDRAPELPEMVGPPPAGPSLAERIVQRDPTVLESLNAMFTHDLGDGYRSEAGSRYGHGAYAVVSGVIRSVDGTPVGSFARTVSSLADGSVAMEADWFRVEHAYQGQGIGTRFTAAVSDTLLAAGVDTVLVDAVSSGPERGKQRANGAYTWAKVGNYDWDPAHLTEVRRVGRMMLAVAPDSRVGRALVEWDGRSTAGVPSPLDVASDPVGERVLKGDHGSVNWHGRRDVSGRAANVLGSAPPETLGSAPTPVGVDGPVAAVLDQARAVADWERTMRWGVDDPAIAADAQEPPTVTEELIDLADRLFSHGLVEHPEFGWVDSIPQNSYLESGSAYDPSVEFYGGIFDEGGDEIGSWRRSLSVVDGLVTMDHETLSLDQSAQGYGIGRAFLTASLDAYRALGIDDVRTQAVSNGNHNGAYTWSVLGFDWAAEPRIRKHDTTAIGQRMLAINPNSAIGRTLAEWDGEDLTDIPTPLDVAADPVGAQVLKGNVSWWGHYPLTGRAGAVRVPVTEAGRAKAGVDDTLQSAPVPNPDPEVLFADPNVGRIIDAFNEVGHPIYVVGGAVRSMLMGEPAADIDLTTSATPDLTTALLDPLGAVYPLGERHGTVAVNIDGTDYEVTTFRTEQYSPESRQPTVQFADTLEEDLGRRDFTFNAMAVGPDRQIIDPYGGRADLAAGLVRAVGDPNERFSEDPLRIARAVRFAATNGFDIAPETVAAAQLTVDRLSVVSKERFGAELDKILKSPRRGVIGAAVGWAERIGAADALFGPLAFGASQMAAAGVDVAPANRLAALVLWSGVDAAPLVQSMKRGRNEMKAVGRLVDAARTLRDGGNPGRVVRALNDGELDSLRDIAPDVWTPVMERAYTNRAALRGDLPLIGSELVQYGIEGREIGQALDRVLTAFLARGGDLTRDQALDAAFGSAPEVAYPIDEIRDRFREATGSDGSEEVPFTAVEANQIATALLDFDLGDGYRSEVNETEINPAGGALISVVGAVTKDGRWIGAWQRDFMHDSDTGELAVYHDSLNLSADQQGRGIGSRFLAEATERYRAAGIDRIDVAAMSSRGDMVGAYVWAAAGFDWDLHDQAYLRGIHQIGEAMLALAPNSNIGRMLTEVSPWDLPDGETTDGWAFPTPLDVAADPVGAQVLKGDTLPYGTDLMWHGTYRLQEPNRVPVTERGRLKAAGEPLPEIPRQGWAAPTVGSKFPTVQAMREPDPGWQVDVTDGFGDQWTINGDVDGAWAESQDDSYRPFDELAGVEGPWTVTAVRSPESLGSAPVPVDATAAFSKLTAADLAEPVNRALTDAARLIPALDNPENYPDHMDPAEALIEAWDYGWNGTIGVPDGGSHGYNSTRGLHRLAAIEFGRTANVELLDRMAAADKSTADDDVEDAVDMFRPGDDLYRPLVDSPDQIRAVLRARYNGTQEALRAAGIGPDDLVTLYRGISNTQREAWETAGRPDRVESAPLAAFTPNIAEAAMYGTTRQPFMANPSDPRVPDGGLVAVQVRAGDIVSVGNPRYTDEIAVLAPAGHTGFAVAEHLSPADGYLRGMFRTRDAVLGAPIDPAASSSNYQWINGRSVPVPFDGDHALTFSLTSYGSEGIRPDPHTVFLADRSTSDTPAGLVEKRALESIIDAYPDQRGLVIHEPVPGGHPTIRTVTVKLPYPVTDSNLDKASADAREIIADYITDARIRSATKPHETLGSAPSLEPVAAATWLSRFGYDPELVGTAERYVAHQPLTAERLAERLNRSWPEWGGSTPDDAAGLVRRAFRKVADAARQGRVFIYMNPGVLDQVLAEGRYRSQHETETSGGYYNPEDRLAFEQDAFGWVEGAAHPVYGLIGADHTDPDDGTEYGYVGIRLRPEVADRVTAAFGDTLVGSSLPIPLASIETATPDQLAAAVGRSSIDQLQAAVDFHPMPSGYIEAQIHGGVTLGDIAEIVAMSPMYADTAFDLGDEYGIPVWNAYDETQPGRRYDDRGQVIKRDTYGALWAARPTPPPEPLGSAPVASEPARPVRSLAALRELIDGPFDQTAADAVVEGLGDLFNTKLDDVQVVTQRAGRATGARNGVRVGGQFVSGWDGDVGDWSVELTVDPSGDTPVWSIDISNVTLDEAARGNGLGPRFVAAVETAARKAGVAEATITAVTDPDSGLHGARVAATLGYDWDTTPESVAAVQELADRLLEDDEDSWVGQLLDGWDGTIHDELPTPLDVVADETGADMLDEQAVWYGRKSLQTANRTDLTVEDMTPQQAARSPLAKLLGYGGFYRPFPKAAQERIEGMMRTWYNADLGDGYRSAVTKVTFARNSAGDDPVTVDGNIYTEDGTVVGSWTRTLRRATLDDPTEAAPVDDFEAAVVNHDLFRLDPAHQGAGLGSRFFAQTVDRYRLAGVPGVITQATSTSSESGDDQMVGALVWAKRGFEWGPANGEDAEHIAELMLGLDPGSSIARMIQTSDGLDDPSFPSPLDVAADPVGRRVLAGETGPVSWAGWFPLDRVPRGPVTEAGRAVDRPVRLIESAPELGTGRPDKGTWEWDQAAGRAFSAGRVTRAELAELGAGHDVMAAIANRIAGGHIDQPPGDDGWRRIPDRMWHVTTAADQVMADRVRTSFEVDQRGLGGSSSEISLASDLGHARAIYDGLLEAVAVARGEVTVRQLVDRAIVGDRGSNPFVGDPWFAGRVRFETDQPDWMPGDPVPDVTPEKTLEVWRAFAQVRQDAGGPRDPFIMTSASALVGIDPGQVAILELAPNGETWGVPLATRPDAADRGEWRIPTGDAVRIVGRVDPGNETLGSAPTAPLREMSAAPTGEALQGSRTALDAWWGESPEQLKAQVAAVVADGLSDDDVDRLAGLAYAARDWHMEPGATKAAKIASRIIRSWARHSWSGFAGMLQLAAADRFNVDFGWHHGGVPPAKIRADMAPVEDIIRRIVDLVYTNTQQWFADRGISEVVAYRGVWNMGPGFGFNPEKAITSAPLTSWSLEPSTAWGFAGQTGTLLAATVPVDRVFAIPHTGIGAEFETELVVIGGNHVAQVVPANKMPLFHKLGHQIEVLADPPGEDSGLGKGWGAWDLTDTDLSGADLADVYFNEADLSAADLRDVDLTGAWLHEVDLRGADLSGAKLDGINWFASVADTDTRWPDGFDPTSIGSYGLTIEETLGSAPAGRADLGYDLPFVDDEQAAIEKARGVLMPGADPGRYDPSWETRKIQVAERYKELADGTIADTPVLMIPSGLLPTLIEDGRYRTQHETGASQGHYDPDYRVRWEHDHLGVPLDHPDADRPVFGTVLEPRSIENAHWYGDVMLVLDPAAVRSRVSLTLGDSLETNAVPIWADQTPTASEDRLAAAVSTFGAVYVETQIHGGVTLDDIAAIVVRRKPGYFDDTSFANVPVDFYRTLLTTAGYGHIPVHAFDDPADYVYERETLGSAPTGRPRWMPTQGYGAHWSIDRAEAIGFAGRTGLVLEADNWTPREVVSSLDQLDELSADANLEGGNRYGEQEITFNPGYAPPISAVLIGPGVSGNDKWMRVRLRASHPATPSGQGFASFDDAEANFERLYGAYPDSPVWRGLTVDPSAFPPVPEAGDRDGWQTWVHGVLDVLNGQPETLGSAPVERPEPTPRTAWLERFGYDPSLIDTTPYGSYYAWIAKEGPDQIRGVFSRVADDAYAGSLVVRVPVEVAPSVLDNGKFKTQHETGSSQGTYSPVVRGEYEQNVFGWDGTTAPPVYGTVASPASSVFATSLYGQIGFRLKPAVASRATVSIGDSLGAAAPLPIDSIAVASDNELGAAIADVGYDIVNHYLNGSEFDPYSYVETQIHGGVTLDDVAEVVIMSATTSHPLKWHLSDVVKAATEAGIPVRFLWPEGVLPDADDTAFERTPGWWGEPETLGSAPRIPGQIDLFATPAPDPAPAPEPAPEPPAPTPPPPVIGRPTGPDMTAYDQALAGLTRGDNPTIGEGAIDALMRWTGDNLADWRGIRSQLDHYAKVWTAAEMAVAGMELGDQPHERDAKNLMAAVAVAPPAGMPLWRTDNTVPTTGDELTFGLLAVTPDRDYANVYRADELSRGAQAIYEFPADTPYLGWKVRGHHEGVIAGKFRVVSVEDGGMDLRGNELPQIVHLEAVPVEPERPAGVRKTYGWFQRRIAMPVTVRLADGTEVTGKWKSLESPTDRYPSGLVRLEDGTRFEPKDVEVIGVGEEPWADSGYRIKVGRSDYRINPDGSVWSKTKAGRYNFDIPEPTQEKVRRKAWEEQRALNELATASPAPATPEIPEPEVQVDNQRQVDSETGPGRAAPRVGPYVTAELTGPRPAQVLRDPLTVGATISQPNELPVKAGVVYSAVDGDGVEWTIKHDSQGRFLTANTDGAVLSGSDVMRLFVHGPITVTGLNTNQAPQDGTVVGAEAELLKLRQMVLAQDATPHRKEAMAAVAWSDVPVAAWIQSWVQRLARREAERKNLPYNTFGYLDDWGREGYSLLAAHSRGVVHPRQAYPKPFYLLEVSSPSLGLYGEPGAGTTRVWSTEPPTPDAAPYALSTNEVRAAVFDETGAPRFVWTWNKPADRLTPWGEPIGSTVEARQELVDTMDVGLVPPGEVLWRDPADLIDLLLKPRSDNGYASRSGFGGEQVKDSLRPIMAVGIAADGTVYPTLRPGGIPSTDAAEAAGIVNFALDDPLLPAAVQAAAQRRYGAQMRETLVSFRTGGSGISRMTDTPVGDYASMLSRRSDQAKIDLIDSGTAPVTGLMPVTAQPDGSWVPDPGGEPLKKIEWEAAFIEPQAGGSYKIWLPGEMNTKRLGLKLNWRQVANSSLPFEQRVAALGEQRRILQRMLSGSSPKEWFGGLTPDQETVESIAAGNVPAAAAPYLRRVMLLETFGVNTHKLIADRVAELAAAKAVADNPFTVAQSDAIFRAVWSDVTERGLREDVASGTSRFDGDESILAQIDGTLEGPQWTVVETVPAEALGTDIAGRDALFSVRFSRLGTKDPDVMVSFAPSVNSDGGREVKRTVRNPDLGRGFGAAIPTVMWRDDHLDYADRLWDVLNANPPATKPVAVAVEKPSLVYSPELTAEVGAKILEATNLGAPGTGGGIESKLRIAQITNDDGTVTPRLVMNGVHPLHLVKARTGTADGDRHVTFEFTPYPDNPSVGKYRVVFYEGGTVYLYRGGSRWGSQFRLSDEFRDANGGTAGVFDAMAAVVKIVKKADGPAKATKAPKKSDLHGTGDAVPDGLTVMRVYHEVMEAIGIDMGSDQTLRVAQAGATNPLGPLAEAKPKVRQAVELGLLAFPKSWTTKLAQSRAVRVRLRTKMGGRYAGVNYYPGYGTGEHPDADTIVTVDPDVTDAYLSTWGHEFGHSMQRSIPGLHQAERWYLASRLARTADPKKRKPRKYDRSKRSKSYIYDDDLGDTYAARTYSGQFDEAQAFEVITVGVQGLYENAQSRAASRDRFDSDPRLAGWAIGMMAAYDPTGDPTVVDAGHVDVDGETPEALGSAPTAGAPSDGGGMGVTAGATELGDIGQRRADTNWWKDPDQPTQGIDPAELKARVADRLADVFEPGDALRLVFDRPKDWWPFQVMPFAQWNTDPVIEPYLVAVGERIEKVLSDPATAVSDQGMAGKPWLYLPTPTAAYGDIRWRPRVLVVPSDAMWLDTPLVDKIAESGTIARWGTPGAERMLNRATAAELVHAWAESATAALSVALAAAAARVTPDVYPAGDLDEWLNYTMPRSAMDRYGGGWGPGDIQEFLARNPVIEAVAEAIYDDTQAWLADHLIDEVTLYRGMVGDTIRHLGTGPEVTDIESNPLSSWAFAYSEAANFADANFLGHENTDTPGVIIEATFPASRIFSIPHTGIGAHHEAEMVVLGGVHPILVETYWGTSYDEDPEDDGETLGSAPVGRDLPGTVYSRYVYNQPPELKAALLAEERRYANWISGNPIWGNAGLLNRGAIGNEIQVADGTLDILSATRMVGAARPDEPAPTPEEVADTARGLLQESVDAMLDNKVTVRVPAGRAADIPGMGIRNMFDVWAAGRSKGGQSVAARTEVERGLFGLEETHDPRDRPVYGYVELPGQLSDQLDTYGTIGFRLNGSRIVRRTTFTIGDSIAAGRPAPADRGWIADLSVPGVGMTVGLYGPELLASRMGGSPLAGFVEAQVHGGLTDGDIVEVMSYSRESDETARLVADELGVPFEPLGSAPGMAAGPPPYRKERWEPGETAQFEYHCLEADESCDANLWRHSHQPVTVLGETDGYDALDDLEGIESTYGERAEAAMPRMYRVRFADGLEYDTTEDELFTDPAGWERPDPPNPAAGVPVGQVYSYQGMKILRTASGFINLATGEPVNQYGEPVDS